MAGSPRPQLNVLRYGPETVEERQDVDVEAALAMRPDGEEVLWVDVRGLGDLAILERLWEAFGVPDLVREDVVNTHQRPKYEEYDGIGYLVVRMLTGPGEQEQVSLVFGDGWLLSFQERPGDVFEGVRERIRRGRRRIRAGGSDYLAYALLDAVVDGFFPVLEQVGDLLEEVEDEALEAPDNATIARLHALRRQLLGMRRALWPVREAVMAMQRGEHEGRVRASTQVYLRDVYDHAVRLMDMLETYRELASSLAEVYYATLSHRMNQVMRVLTVVATIFIPLTFVAGVYGMNFIHMPELEWRYGYFGVLAFMGVVALGMLFAFRRRGWV